MKVKFFFFALLAAFFFIGSAAEVQAQTTTPGVTKRQVKQQKRIVQGARSGELTRKEVRKLEQQQRRVNRHKRRTKADGVVTKRERAGVHMHQNKASRNIKRQKRDPQSRN